MDQELTKAEKRRLRELVGVAYERELSAELAKLEAEFTRWRGWQISAFDLSEAIHGFHQGAARELFSKYSAYPEVVVRQALQRGILSSDEVGAELVAYLGRMSG